MRKRKTIKIDDKEITLKELTVAEILEFQDLLTSGDDSIGGFLDLLKNLLPNVTDDVNLEDLKKMAPSEIEALIDGFKEVNAPFLKGIVWVGLGDLMTQLRQAMVTDLLRSFSVSQGRDT